METKNDILLRNVSCYVVIGNTDIEEGRGLSYPICFAETHEIATSYAKGVGVQGFEAPIENVIVDVVVPAGDWYAAYVQTIKHTKKNEVRYYNLRTKFVDCTFEEAVAYGVEKCKAHDGTRWEDYDEWSKHSYAKVASRRWRKPGA